MNLKNEKVMVRVGTQRHGGEGGGGVAKGKKVSNHILSSCGALLLLFVGLLKENSFGNFLNSFSKYRTFLFDRDATNVCHPYFFSVILNLRTG